MKFNPIPVNPIDEKREVENALHEGMRFEVRTARRYRPVRAFYKGFPWAKALHPEKYFVWNIKANIQIN